MDGPACGEVNPHWRGNSAAGRVFALQIRQLYIFQLADRRNFPPARRKILSFGLGFPRKVMIFGEFSTFCRTPVSSKRRSPFQPTTRRVSVFCKI